MLDDLDYPRCSVAVPTPINLRGTTFETQVSGNRWISLDKFQKRSVGQQPRVIRASYTYLDISSASHHTFRRPTARRGAVLCHPG
jgi:hypothetical protein